MELEYFCRAEQGMELLEYWKEERLKFYENIGIARSKLHVLTVPDEERAFYSKGTYDIEYDFPFGRQDSRVSRIVPITICRSISRPAGNLLSTLMRKPNNDLCRMLSSRAPVLSYSPGVDL